MAETGDIEGKGEEAFGERDKSGGISEDCGTAGGEEDITWRERCCSTCRGGVNWRSGGWRRRLVGGREEGE